MSQLTNSIIRGAGNAIGRNLVNGRPRRSYSSSPRRGRGRAKSDLEKAISFEIKGKVSTMVGKCYNMLQHFEDDCNGSVKISKSMNICLWDSFAFRFNQVKNKINDVAGYLEILGEGENEQWIKIIDEMTRIVNNYVEYSYNFIINNPSKTSKENVVSIINTYKQCFPYKEVIDINDVKISSTTQTVNSEESSSNMFFQLVGLGGLVFFILKAIF